MLKKIKRYLFYLNLFRRFQRTRIQQFSFRSELLVNHKDDLIIMRNTTLFGRTGGREMVHKKPSSATQTTRTQSALLL